MGFEGISMDAFGPCSYLIIALLVVLLTLLGLIAAFKSAYFNLSSHEREEIAQEEQSSDRTLRELLQYPERLLATLLAVCNIIHICIILLSVSITHTIFSSSAFTPQVLWTEAFVLLAVLLLFGEFIPKHFAQNNSLRTARRLTPLIKALCWAMRPITTPLASKTDKEKNAHNKRAIDASVDQISKALELTGKELKEEKEMLQEIIRLGDKTAEEIMTPRLDMADIDIHMNLSEVVDYIIQVGYSRIPVYEGTPDTIVGILVGKDLLPHVGKSDDFAWQDLIRPAYLVSETKPVDDLLDELRKEKVHLAIVVDEYGGTSGVITLEDVLEEIVGEISDEYDDEDDTRLWRRLRNNSYLFEGKIQLQDFYRTIGAEEEEFGDLTEEADTLAGLLIELKGDLPTQGEEVTFGRYQFRIIAIEKRRIKTIKLTILPLVDEDE